MKKISDRFASSAAALALQFGFLLLIAQALHFTAPHKPLARELVLILPRLRAISHPPLPRLPGRRAPFVMAPARPQRLPPSPSSTAPVNPPLDTIRGFGRALNDCAPENYNNLSVEEKAHCVPLGAGVAIQEAPNLMGSPSQVKNQALWQEEWAREQSPLLLPCGLHVNVTCLLGKLADGSLSDFGDPSTWPRYAVKQIPPEDFYRIRKAYDAWHAEHGAAQKQQR